MRPSENLPLIQAVHLINVRTKLQLNLEASSPNPPDLVVFTNLTFESFGRGQLFQWAKSITNYTLLGDNNELELTLVANENLRPGAPLSLSDPLPTFGLTNVEICQMTAALSNAVPFGIEFWSPRPPGRFGNGPLESLEAHWSLRDLRHLVTLPARPQTLRDVLNEVFSPHFKSYWISGPTPPQTATNAIFVRVFRPEDSQAPAYNSEP